jgi:hypothetical protein
VTLARNRHKNLSQSIDQSRKQSPLPFGEKFVTSLTYVPIKSLVPACLAHVDVSYGPGDFFFLYFQSPFVSWRLHHLIAGALIRAPPTLVHISKEIMRFLTWRLHHPTHLFSHGLHILFEMTCMQACVQTEHSLPL